MQPTHAEAEKKYKEFRAIARNAVKNNLSYSDNNKIFLRDVDNQALALAKEWEKDINRIVDWSWSSGYQHYSFSRPKRFELAIWYDNKLCSLSLGRPSFHGTRLRLEFIESHPSDNPLKGRIAPIVISTAEVYAQIIGADELRIIDPIDKNLIDYYSTFGYKYVSGSAEKTKHYLVKLFP